MISFLVTILKYIPYIILAYFGCQILTRLTSKIIPYMNEEKFTHQMEYGPFDEEEQKYNLPQPSEPVNNSVPEPVVSIDNSVPEPVLPLVNKVKPLKSVNNSLDNQYNKSRIGLDAKIIDPSVSELEKEFQSRKSDIKSENTTQSNITWDSINECGPEGCKTRDDRIINNTSYEERKKMYEPVPSNDLEETTSSPFSQ